MTTNVAAWSWAMMPGACGEATRELLALDPTTTEAMVVSCRRSRDGRDDGVVVDTTVVASGQLSLRMTTRWLKGQTLGRRHGGWESSKLLLGRRGQKLGIVCCSNKE
jgi:hypothetical protein